MRARAGQVALVVVSLLGCGPTGPEPFVPRPPPSPVPVGSGWRTLGVYPDEPNPEAGYFPYSTDVAYGGWMGDLEGRVSALACINTNVPGLSGCQAAWVSVPIDGMGRVDVVGTPWSRGDVGPLRVLDSATEFYGWAGGLQLQRRRPYPPEGGDEVLEVVFDVSEGVRVGADPGVPPIGTANAVLDIAVTGQTGLYGTPLLFVREQGAATGSNFATNRRELVRARDVRARYGGDDPLPFDPVDGTPLLVQLGSYGHEGATVTRVVLSLFAPTDETLDADPTVEVLRRVDEVEVADGSSVRLLVTPRRAWALVDEGAEWSLYRLDRASARLVHEWTMDDPVGASISVVGVAATDDGVVYVGGATEASDPTVLRIVDGVASELWPSDTTSSPLRLLDLYSSGARVFVMVGDTYPFTHLPTTHPETLSHARVTFLTPDLADVPAPPAPSMPPALDPPPACNPVTNDGCAATEACDAGPSRNGFTCHSIGAAPPCGPCNPSEGPFCGVGYSCFATSPTEGQCVRLCCTDADCGGGPGGPRCAIDSTARVGYCASVRVDVFVPSCVGIPVVPPSGGTCGSE